MRKIARSYKVTLKVTVPQDDGVGNEESIRAAQMRLIEQTFENAQQQMDDMACEVVRIEGGRRVLHWFARLEG